jgi:hypothetical protein
MAIVAISCLVEGLVYAPFSPIPNGFNTPTTKIVTFGKIDFPEQLIYQYLPNNPRPIVGCSHTADLTFTLSGDEIVSGKVLDVRITMDACRVVVNNTNVILVRMENALEAGFSSSNPINALVVMSYTTGLPGLDNFLGNHKILYLVSGTFTATVVFVLRNGTELPCATGALFPIESPEIIVARQNEALTTSLTFFVLMFAAIEVRADSRQDYPSNASKNRTVDNQNRDNVKSGVRLVEVKVAPNGHPDEIHQQDEEKAKTP